MRPKTVATQYSLVQFFSGSVRGRAALLNGVLPVTFDDSELTRWMSKEVRGDNVIALINRLLEAARRDAGGLRPALLVLDDAHWVDSSSWRLAESVWRGMSGFAVLLVARPLAEYDDEAGYLCCKRKVRQPRILPGTEWLTQTNPSRIKPVSLPQGCQMCDHSLAGGTTIGTPISLLTEKTLAETLIQSKYYNNESFRMPGFESSTMLIHRSAASKAASNAASKVSSKARSTQ